jgi:uncharacterized protein involved in exopolysaccharide biosynthesis/Mrp family chromosome partitioning ATPase
MAAFFVTVVTVTLLVLVFYPRSYISEAKLFVSVGRESVSLDPTATTGQTIMLHKSQVDEVNSALDILSSRQVQRGVVDQVGASRILDDTPVAEPMAAGKTSEWKARFRAATAAVSSWLSKTLQQLNLSEPGSEVDLAVRDLEKGVRVWAPKQSTVITIRYFAASPQLAHDVVAATTNVFLQEHLRLNHTEQSHAFFSAQAESLHDALLAAQGKLRDRKNEFQVASIDSRRAIFEDQIQDVELELLGVERQLAFAEAKAADLTRALADLKPELVTNRVAGFANEARDDMRAKLYELELEETRLRSRYREDHPRVQQIQRQRKQAQEILAEVPNDRMQTTEALNLNQRRLELELMQAQATAAALQAQKKAAQAQHQEIYRQLESLNSQEVELAGLQRDVDLLEDKYRMHMAKLEEARLNDEMGDDGIQNVKVAQPASLVLKPVSPNKRLVMALGLIFGFGGCIGLAFLSEGIDQTFRTTQQVELQLGLPVLASWPLRKGGRRRAWSRRHMAIVNGKRRANGEASRHALGKYRELVRELVSPSGRFDYQAKTIGIVGCDDAKLRSRVAAQLARQAAHYGGYPVLLVDGDARRRQIAKRFQVNELPGWSDVLVGEADVESCIQSTDDGGFSVMSAGESNGHSHAVETAVGVMAQLDDIKTKYGLVVVDLPTSRDLAPPLVADEWLDEVVLVIEAERTRIQAARRVKEMFQRAGLRITGVVFANRREYIPRWLYRRL